MSRVFVVTSVHGRYDVRIFLKQCRSISSYGHDVTLVVQDGKGDEIRDGVKFLDLGLPVAGRLRRMLFSPWRMYRLLRSAPADLFHFHDPELLPVAYVLKKCGRRAVYDSHEDVPRQILSKHWLPSMLRGGISRFFEIFENIIARQLDAVVCSTPFIAKRFREINSMSVDINNYPIIDEFQQLDPLIHKNFNRTICYIGAITRERGIIELIDALEILQDISLIMCGPFESRAFEDELKSMTGWRNVDYRGIVGRADVVEILKSSSIGMVTLLPTPNQIDSLPIKMFEYMAAGIPIIASDFPLWRQIIENSNCGLCVDPSSPNDVADAIARLLSNETLCRDMGSAGMKAVADSYNWSNESQKLLELYNEVLNRRS